MSDTEAGNPDRLSASPGGRSHGFVQPRAGQRTEDSMRRLGGCRHQLFSKRSVGTASDIPKAFEILIALPHQFGVLRDDKIGTAAEAKVMGSEGR